METFKQTQADYPEGLPTAHFPGTRHGQWLERMASAPNAHPAVYHAYSALLSGMSEDDVIRGLIIALVAENQSLQSACTELLRNGLPPQVIILKGPPDDV